MTTRSLSASSRSMTAGSGSYSTTTTSTASRASAFERATTTATASPTYATLSIASGKCSGAFMSGVTAHAHGIGPHESRRSAPLYAATTPGMPSAADTSTLRMRAWA